MMLGNDDANVDCPEAILLRVEKSITDEVSIMVN